MNSILRYGVILVAILGAGSLSAIGQQTAPNVILILADDLGYGDVGFNGQEIVYLPHIDRLAAEGVVFSQFYAGSPVCAPSRSVLLTGQHSGHTYIRGNRRVVPEGQYPLADSVFTLAELFKRAGYSTGAFGKWGLGPVGSSGDPNKQGFDRFFGYNSQSLAHRYFPAYLWNNSEKVTLTANGKLENRAIYAPDLIQSAALHYLDTVRKDRPFFLFRPMILPHAELLVPEDSLWEKFKARFPEEPFVGNDYGKDAHPHRYASQRYPRAAFAAMLTRMDLYLGQLINRLDSLGIADNTIVIFTSDNGPHREGGADPDFFNSNGGLRGYKRDLYEGGIRVPFVVRWPAQIKKGVVSDHIGAFWDLMPTFADLIGEEPEANTDGISVLPELTGNGTQGKHAYLYWEFHEQGGKQSIRIGDWKGIKLNASVNPRAKMELYDLTTDPGETNDVSEAHPDLVSSMLELMSSARTESQAFPFFIKN